MKYGLIGYPLGHSFSPAYFAEKFAREGIAATYTSFPLRQIEDLPPLIAGQPLLRGLNVTTPYKQAVTSYLDGLNKAAREIGAVNCISIQGGRLYGYNTDWIGFRDSIQPMIQPHHSAALVLGMGGASLAIRYALREMGIAFQTVSQTKGKADLTYDDVTGEVVQAHWLIINTTILGTEGKGCPRLPFDALTPRHLLYDLVYNPSLTPFLTEAKKRGAGICNGFDMLKRQAEASWEIWQSGLILSE